MSNPIAVVTSDVHLAQRAWLRHPGLEGDSYFGLSQIVKYCVKKDLPLIMAGDVFDKTRPDPRTIDEARKQMEIMASSKLPVYFTQGQHELDRNRPWLNAISDWPIHINKQSLKIGGIWFYGLDWQPMDVVKQELDAVSPSMQILVAHQVWYDLLKFVGSSECAFSDVSHVKVMITGDMHKHMIHKAINKQGQDFIVLSPGPVCMQAIHEEPNKHFFVLHDDLSFESIPLKTRRVLRFNIDTAEKLDSFLFDAVTECATLQDDVPDNIAKNLIHVVYNGAISGAYHRITSALTGRAHLFLVAMKRMGDGRPVDTEHKRLSADGSLISCLELVVHPNSVLHKDLSTLLRSPNPEQQLVEMQDNFRKRAMSA